MKINPHGDSTGSLYLPDETSTLAFGAHLAAATRGLQGTAGGQLHLAGDLGAGKTTLARGLIRAYGHGGAVKSPTYTLVEPYEGPDHCLYHFDLYRLEDPEEVEFLGVHDYFEPQNLCLVEWADKGKGAIPGPDLELALTSEGTGRRITWKACTSHGVAIARRLAEELKSPTPGMP